MQNQPVFKKEFIALMAALMSLVALSIDALLPALPNIGEDLGVTNLENNQLLITMIFLGLGSGQLIFGPLSDSFGRKPIVYIGFLIFIIASIICVNTKSFEIMILGRILQGVGLSSPRTISIAMIRDSYSGDFMAKVLSIVVSFFILIPTIAPAIGQFFLDNYGWQSIFNVNLFIGLFIIIWFWKRQPETIKKENQVPFSIRLFVNGTKTFFKHKDAVAFTFISGFITGSFMVYLSTSQQIFEQQYGLGEWFPYLFASTALAVGSSTFMNSQLVIKYGSFKIAYGAIIAYLVISLVYIIFFFSGNNPSIYVLIIFFLMQFFAIGLLFGNLRSLAMQPLGHIAGIGSAINGFVSTALAVPIANYIGSFVKTSVLPMFIGFAVFGLLSLIVIFYVRRKNKLITIL